MERYEWIDRLRVTAIFLVIVVHGTEPFYLGGEGSLLLSSADLRWVSFFDSLARACVPLFIIASSYLLFPLRGSASAFFRRRLGRVFVPFAVWTAVYALVWGEPVDNFRDLLLNFNYSAGHLWFVYMLAGVYLLLPIMSPWAERVSRRELLFYIGVCFATTFIPLVRGLCSGEAPVVYGPSGIPNFAKFPLWGEASWNAYGVFYYFSGFIGYILLGLYFRRFAGRFSWSATVVRGVLPWLAGFAICFFGFIYMVLAMGDGVFPVEGPVGLAALWETPWFYDSTGVALMALGWIVVFRKTGSSGGRFYRWLTLPLAKSSYGVYLCHMLILVPVSAFFRDRLGLGPDGVLGVWTTPVQIVATAVTTFVAASCVSFCIGRIPKIGRYIVG